MTRLPPMKISPGYEASDTKRAALALINELNGERRISTAEVKVLLAVLIDVPVTHDLSHEFRRYLREDRSKARAISEATS